MRVETEQRSPARATHYKPLSLALRVVTLLITLLGLTASAQSTRPTPRTWDLFAHGSPDRLWYAVTTPTGTGGDVRTFIRARAAQGKWEEAANFPARLTALSEAEARGIAAIAGGEWKRVAPGQFSSGPPIPGGGDLIAVASNGRTIWAVAAGGAPPTSAPATRPTTAASNLLRLWRLEGARWHEVAALPPPAASPDGRPVALVIDGHAPVVAFRSNTPTVAQVFRWAGEPSPSWVAEGELHAADPIRKLSLLVLDASLIGWSCGEGGGGAFHVRDAGGAWAAKPVTLAAGVVTSDVAVASFHGELRLIAVTPDEKFLEQRFDRAAQTTTAWQPLEPPEADDTLTLGQIAQWLALFVVVVVTLATTNRGGVVQVAVVNKVRLALAPVPLRLAAGLVDLWPFFLASLVVGRVNEGAKLSEVVGDVFAYRALAAAFGVYFLHTVVCELIWGRSLGKMFVGLRVVGVDGRRPRATGVILRNLIRLIEVPILAPLAFVLLNPLRQRFGDFFGATVVTVKLPRELEQRLE